MRLRSFFRSLERVLSFLRVITFNVNSIAKRLSVLLAFIDEHSVDVALLQELKSPAERFPRSEIEAAGWQVAFVAEKGFNGVAVLSRDPAMLVRRRALPLASLDDEPDEQARYLEVATHGIVVVCLYAPNGNPVNNADDDPAGGHPAGGHPAGGHPSAGLTTSKKFRYKLSWMDRLCSHIENHLLLEGCHFLLGGDFNICPQASDVFDEQVMAGDALLQIESRRRYRRLVCSGLVDAWRALPLVGQGRQQQAASQQSDSAGEVGDNGYTYWDYRRGRFQRDEGLRIDMFFLSPYLSERLEGCFVASHLRALDSPSDHAPLCLDLACDDRLSSKAPRASEAIEVAPTKTKEQDAKERAASEPLRATSVQKTLEM